MKRKDALNEQLVLREVVLVPGGEWALESCGWSFLRVSRGVGYWMDPRANYDLATGSTLVLPHGSKGTIRSSQLGDVVVQYFAVEPQKLTGLVSFSEQRTFGQLVQREPGLVRCFSPSDSSAQRFALLGEQTGESRLRLRLRMLDLFVEAVEPELTVGNVAVTPESSAERRLEELLGQMPAAEIIDLSFGELADQIGCCRRHMCRLFHRVMGMSFREKQTEVRLAKARELLAKTEAKVVDVAFESGYPSLSLFNLVFKKRFGVSPSKWRQQHRQESRPMRHRKALSVVVA